MSKRGKEGGYRKASHTSYASVTGGITLSPDNPVLLLFKDAAVQLTARHDRHERLVKLSRDITIESKRVIFQLHSALEKETQQSVATEAMERLQKLVQGPIKAIGIELENHPQYLHGRGYSPGFQEFIEAISFCHLIQHKELITYEAIQKLLTYTEGGKEDEAERTITTLLPETDYMLGLADLTGELMRRTINCISSGEMNESMFACQVIKEMYTGFLSITHATHELNRKLPTTRMNTLKSEGAVFAVKVRGGEAPPSMLASSIAMGGEREDEDEGFY